MAWSQAILLPEPPAIFRARFSTCFALAVKSMLKLRPCLYAFLPARFLPPVERGPVLLAELARFAWSCRSLATGSRLFLGLQGQCWLNAFLKRAIRNSPYCFGETGPTIRDIS